MDGREPLVDDAARADGKDQCKNYSLLIGPSGCPKQLGSEK